MCFIRELCCRGSFWEGNQSCLQLPHCVSCCKDKCLITVAGLESFPNPAQLCWLQGNKCWDTRDTIPSSLFWLSQCQLPRRFSLNMQALIRLQLPSTPELLSVPTAHDSTNCTSEQCHQSCCLSSPAVSTRAWQRSDTHNKHNSQTLAVVSNLALSFQSVLSKIWRHKQENEHIKLQSGVW